LIQPLVIGTSVTDQVSVTMQYNKSGGGNGHTTLQLMWG